MHLPGGRELGLAALLAAGCGEDSSDSSASGGGASEDGTRAGERVSLDGAEALLYGEGRYDSPRAPRDVRRRRCSGSARAQNIFDTAQGEPVTEAILDRLARLSDR